MSTIQSIGTTPIRQNTFKTNNTILFQITFPMKFITDLNIPENVQGVLTHPGFIEFKFPFVYNLTPVQNIEILNHLCITNSPSIPYGGLYNFIKVVPSVFEVVKGRLSFTFFFDTHFFDILSYQIFLK